MIVRVVESQQPAAASGFSIFCDDDDDATQGGAPFEIYQDTRESVGDTATFSVLASALQTSSPVGAAPTSTAAATGFEIFNDKDDDKRSSGGDTATFSLLGDVLKPSAPPSVALLLLHHRFIFTRMKRIRMIVKEILPRFQSLEMP